MLYGWHKSGIRIAIDEAKERYTKEELKERWMEAEQEWKEYLEWVQKREGRPIARFGSDPEVRPVLKSKITIYKTAYEEK